MSDAHLFEGYGPVSGYDEMFARRPTRVRENYTRRPARRSRTMGDDEVRQRADALASSYLDQGVTFGVEGEERPFPLDIVPRLIEAEQWDHVDRGVRQRVRALEAFLADIYGTGELFADGVMPRSVVMTSPHFHRVVAGLEPPNGVRIHVAGVDLIRDGEGDFRVLEDNVRVPSGVSYVMTNRRALSAALPEVFADHRIRPVVAVLAGAARRPAASPRRPASATRPSSCSRPASTTRPTSSTRCWPAPWASSSSRAATSCAAPAACMMRTTRGLEPVHVIYRRIDDEFLDPVQFRADSALGVPGIINAARAGHVTIANAVGNGVADDKLLYTYVPDLIRYYLSRGADPARTSTPGGWATPSHREEVLDRLDELVLKPVDGSGGKGIVIGPAASPAELDELRGKVLADPRAWIAQPVVSLSTVPTLVENGIRPRHVDLRPFAVQRRRRRLGAARRPHPRRAPGGRADRQLQPRRRVQGHLGDGRRRRRGGRAATSAPPRHAGRRHRRTSRTPTWTCGPADGMQQKQQQQQQRRG